MSEPANPAAFPTIFLPESHSERAGMTMRDYFAAHALSGLCAHGEADSAPGYAYWLADQMLLARAPNEIGEE